MKYTGEYLMDDTGIKNQQIVAGKIKVKLEALLGPGSMVTNLGVDNLRLLKWSFVTDSDETPSTRTVVIDPNTVDDPARLEIEEHAKADDKERKALSKVDEDDRDRIGAYLGSEGEESKMLRAQN